MTHEIQQRKDSHLDLCLHEAVERQGVTALFEHVHLIHDALPELATAALRLETTVLGKVLKAPLLVVGMTGGTPRAAAINRDLAQVAERHGVAFGVGSQRAMVKRPESAASYQVRDVAPSVLLFGNIGAQQIEELGVDRIQELVKRIGADGIFVHLNPAQELVQPEGDRSFTGCLDGIRKLAGVLGPRVWVKETGCGISPHVARRLVAAGVGGIDVSGAGGTSWTRVEALRATGLQKAVGDELSAWGIPTAAAVAALAGLEVPIVASGGVRSGSDIAKALALGATLGGMALPYLKAHERAGQDGVDETLRWVRTGLEASLLLTGSRDVAALREKPRVLTGELPNWIATLRGAK